MDAAAVARLMDPEIAAALTALDIPPLDLSPAKLPAMRAERAAQAAAARLSDRVSRRDIIIPGSDGDPDVRLRITRPVDAQGALGCLYWVHGGGYVSGLVEQNDPMFDHLCTTLGCTGVSVAYRLSPETPYPGGLHDCYAGLLYAHKHAGELGIDPTRLGIGGASAGGGLAAGLGLLARDRGEIPVAFQYLVYPMIDDRQVTDSSSWDVPVWSPEANTFGWKAYLGDLYGTDAIPPYAAATRATHLGGLPPTYIVVGSLDGFLEEDVEYAMRLTRAGVSTELHVHPGAPHGFDAFLPGTKLSRRARVSADDWLRRMLDPEH